LPHGFVDRVGSEYRFSFNRVPKIEALESVARIFSAPVEWSGPESAEFTGSFVAGTPGEALAKLAEGSGRSVRLEGSAWSLREEDPKAPVELNLADFSTAAKGGR
jgi:hypothetical protein